MHATASKSYTLHRCFRKPHPSAEAETGPHLRFSREKMRLARFCPRWKDTRLAEFRAKEVIDWLQDTCASWHHMADLRGIMSGVITKAQEWELLPETFANPIRRVKLPKKWEVREKRILDEDQTARVLARLENPNLLICETCLDTDTRISEVTGLPRHAVRVVVPLMLENSDQAPGLHREQTHRRDLM